MRESSKTTESIDEERADVPLLKQLGPRFITGAADERAVRIGIVALLIVANTLNIAADFGAMADARVADRATMTGSPPRSWGSP
jgi:hypothetical protein